MILQRIQGLERREPGLPRRIALENGKQAAGFFRQFRRLFCHDFAVVNLDFKCEVAHGNSVIVFLRLAKFASDQGTLNIDAFNLSALDH